MSNEEKTIPGDIPEACEPGPPMNAGKYLVLGTLGAIFLPTMIVSLPLLFLACFSPLCVVALPLLLLDLYLLYLLKSRFLPRFQALVRADRLPRSAFVLYLPLFLPLLYFLAVTAFGFSDYFPDMNARQAYFCWFLAPYFFIVLTASFFMLFGNLTIEALPAVPLLSAFLTAFCGSCYLFRKTSRSRTRLPVLALFILASLFLAARIAFEQTWMREYSLGVDWNVETVLEERSRYAWHDETDLRPYLPFSAENKLVAIEGDIELRIEKDHPVLHGALALYPVYAAAAQATYKRIGPGEAENLIRGGTSPQAFEALIEGKTDMAFMLKPSEKQFREAKAAGKTLSVVPIGREAFVFFVSRDNPVDGLSSRQIRDIYSKRIVRWEELGGPRAMILPFQRPDGSGSQTAMERFMGDQPMARPVREEYQELMGGIVNRVADYRNYGNAIGYSFRYYVEGMFKHEGVKLLRVDGVEPSPDNIRSGDYPLVGEMAIVTAGTSNPNVPELIDWFLSPQGRELIDRVGYVPLHRTDDSETETEGARKPEGTR